jgi:hypothetical protein
MFICQEELSEKIAYTKTGSGQSPNDGVLIAYDPAAAAFQTAFVGKADISFPGFEAISRAGVCAWMSIACLADIFFYLDMPLFIDVVFVDGQFVFYVSWFHIALFIWKRSLSIRQRDIFPLCDSRNIFQNFFLDLPSPVKIFSASSQASSGYWL